MILADAVIATKTWQVKYLIVGYKHDGYRSMPPNFIDTVVTVNTEKELFKAVKEFTTYKVFSIEKEFLTEKEINKKAQEYKKKEEEEREKKELAALLKKYPDFKL